MALVKDEEQHSQNPAKNKKKKSQSRTPSRSKSRTRHKKSKTSKKKHHKSSRSKSKSNSRSSRSKSRSRSRGRKHASSNHKRHRSPSRSKSSRSRSYSSKSRSRSQSRSYDRYHNKKRYPDARDIHPPKGRVLGCFGLSPRTTGDDIKTVFSRYGEIENVVLIVDLKTGISKGYAFIYFETVEQAEHAKESATGMELDGRRIRVDYSVTQRPHSPTPGRYYGSKTQRNFNGNNNYNGSNYNPNYERKNDRYGASSDRDVVPSRRRKSRSDSRDRGRDRYSGNY